MNFIAASRRLLLLAFAVILWACSGQSQITPGGSGNVSRGVARELASSQMPSEFVRPLTWVQPGCPNHVWLFASDNVTGNVDEFCEDAVIFRLVAVCPNCGGWGLAVSPFFTGPGYQDLAIGTKTGKVTIWTVKLSTGAVSAVPKSTLKLTHAGDAASGICFEKSGGLYATDFGHNVIDFFNAASLAGPGSFTPTGKWLTTNVTQPYAIACDIDSQGAPENYLMAVGLDTTNQQVTLSQVVNGPPPSGAQSVDDTPESTFGGASFAFPGGMALDKNDDLVISFRGSSRVYDMGNAEPWSGAGTFCTAPGPYAGIAFDDEQNEIWAGYLMTTTTTEVASAAYPLTAGCPPGTSGGPALPEDGEQQYFGVAVAPNEGV